MTELPLNPKELALIKNSEVLHLKSSAIQKVKHQLELLQIDLFHSVVTHSGKALKNVLIAPAKISKGENYLGLPYLVLDYPAQFSSKSIFTFRTLFWWGNFFSFTLHLQGEVLENFRNALVQNCQNLRGADYFLCVADSPWNYSYDENNYKPVDLFSDTELLSYFRQRNFIKISAKMDLEIYRDLVTNGVKEFHKMIALLE